VIWGFSTLVPQETNKMINSFLGKVKNLWPLELTTNNRPKTIVSEAYSMSAEPANPSPVYNKVGPKNGSDSQPEKAHKSVTVVCACILKEGGQEVLLSMRRAPGVAGLDGRWELPGGKIEFGETPERAIVREIQEEVGLKVRPIRLLPYLHTNLWEYEHAIQHVVLACYECELEKRSSEGFDEGTARWFHINQIDFNLTLPGTREFVSLAAQNDWFDKLYIKFECVDSATRTSKWFAVATQATLFSKYGLVKYWGRRGTNPISKRQEFTSPRELDEQIFETVKKRLAAGYHISDLKGPEGAPEMVTRIIELVKQGERNPISEIA
jgi:8-oxo-dGTP diphosphatase